MGRFFSHPADFTPVCTTELGRAAALNGEFQKRGVKPICISVDGIDDHHAWAKDIGETQGTELNFPIIADPNKEVAELYDMMHPNADSTHTVRSVFIIDPNKKIRLTLTYPASCGRNFDGLSVSLMLCNCLMNIILRRQLTGKTVMMSSFHQVLKTKISQLNT